LLLSTFFFHICNIKKEWRINAAKRKSVNPEQEQPEMSSIKVKIVNPSVVQKLLPWVQCYGNRSKKKLYLTFDDGPDPRFTPEILTILSDFGIKGHFFLRGDRIEQNPSIVREITEAGSVVGNHGYSHTSLIFRSAEFIRQEIEKTNVIIRNITGAKPVYFRPPYGRFDLRFKKIMTHFKMRLVLWSLLTYDFTEKYNVNSIVNTYVRNGSILVFHDGLKISIKTVKMLPDIIRTLQNRGYEFSLLKNQTGE